MDNVAIYGSWETFHRRAPQYKTRRRAFSRIS